MASVQSTTVGKSAADLVQEAIADLEAKLGLMPGQPLPSTSPSGEATNKKNGGKEKKEKKKNNANDSKKEAPTPNLDQPDICKLEFKVGQITKVWNHPEADKLYCEEIDVGEVSGPRQIASGLRPHYTLEEMEGRRLLVITNLKPRNLVGFKSFGMVLCAAEEKADGTGELVEFVEPPADAPLGEVVTFEGLPEPEPLSAAQVEKKKIFVACLEGMKTLDDCSAAWNGHVFMTSAGPCKSKTIAGGAMR